MSFDDLKRRSQSGELLNTQLDADVQIANRKIQKRVIKALETMGDDDGLDALSLAYRIKGCSKGQFCGSVYCIDCRWRAARALNERLQVHIESRFGNDKVEAQETLRYVTVLCELTDFDFDAVAQSVKQARKHRNAVKRHFKNKGIDLWGQGSFEFELMDMKLLMGSKIEGSDVKRNTLSAMKGMTIKECSALGHQVIVHFHMLVDLNGADEIDFKRYLAKRFGDVSRQIDVGVIHKDQELTEMMSKISSYGFKNRHRYNFEFETIGYLRGKYFDDECLGKLAGIYDAIDGRGYSGLLISL
jgi:hypothetical protein